MMRTMVTVLASLLAAALAVVITLRWGVVATRKDDLDSPMLHGFVDSMTMQTAALSELDARMGRLEADHLDVRAAVAHGIEDVTRVDNRIKATIRRTTKQLEEAGVESPALNAEVEHFRLIDGGGGVEPGLPPVQEDVDDAASSIPGVSASDLAKVRGLYGSA